ncbi:MAG TPA: hypothetical protein VFK34_09845 [Marmoricola sp.]|jgi:hypothetical protein|nr:hypothetical protein [Marmoricola sp.]
MTDIDVDEAMAMAWSTFHDRLVEGVGRMRRGDRIRLEVPVAGEVLEGDRPYVGLVAGDDARMVAWLPANETLDPTCAMDPAAERFLASMGWERQGDGPFEVSFGRDEASRGAALVMHALQQVFAVVHPVFLEPDAAAMDVLHPGWDEAPDEEECGHDLVADDLEPWAEDEEPLGLVCESPAELRDAARRALVGSLGYVPVVDDDGDIPVAGNGALLWVEVCVDEPRLVLFSTVVAGIKRRGAATVEVGLLNRDRPYLKFRLVDDRIVVRAELPAVPFCPAQLRLLVERMQEALCSTPGDLVARCGGEPWAVFGSA